MEEQTTLSPNPERALTRIMQDIINKRLPQHELYSNVVFPKDHLVGQAKAIPVLADHLILAPGHLDPLYQRGLIPEENLYKITQTQLQEGLQKGQTTTTTKKRPLEQLAAGKKIHKEQDFVYANVDMQKLLTSDGLKDPVNQTMVLYMIDQQLGNISIRHYLEGVNKEYRNTKNISEQKFIRDEAVRQDARLISQYQAVDTFLQNFLELYPHAANIADVSGKTTYVDKIRNRLTSDLGLPQERASISNITEFSARQVSNVTNAA